MLEENVVKFPKRFINTQAIKPVEYRICVTKPTEEGDVFRTIRDDFGKVYKEQPLGDWTILASEKYEIEEQFWIYGMNPKKNRPKIDEIVKRIMKGAYKKNMSKQIIVVHNKLVIFNEEQFDMVLCKCREDAQRLHHALAKITKKMKIKSLLFMGTATPATIERMYDIIRENTGWKIEKIRRYCTRP